MNVSKFKVKVQRDPGFTEDHYQTLSKEEEIVQDEISGFSDTETKEKEKKKRIKSRRHKRRTSRSESRSNVKSSSRRSTIKKSERRSSRSNKTYKPKYTTHTLYGDVDCFALPSLNYLDAYNLSKNDIKKEKDEQMKSSSNSSQEDYEYFKFCPNSSQILQPIQTDKKCKITDNSKVDTNNSYYSNSQESPLFSDSQIRSSPLFNSSPEQIKSTMDIHKTITEPIIGNGRMKFKIQTTKSENSNPSYNTISNYTTQIKNTIPESITNPLRFKIKSITPTETSIRDLIKSK